jgi:hypothetical protein
LLGDDRSIIIGHCTDLSDRYLSFDDDERRTSRRRKKSIHPYPSLLAFVILQWQSERRGSMDASDWLLFNPHIDKEARCYLIFLVAPNDESEFIVSKQKRVFSNGQLVSLFLDATDLNLERD